EVKAPNIVALAVTIRGISPLVMHKFSRAAREKLALGMATPKNQKNKNDRSVRDYDQEFKDAHHFSDEGWVGVPCSAFKDAMVDAGRAANLVMTMTNIALIDALPDGLDVDEGIGLVRIHGGAPQRHESVVRLPNGAPDIRVRPIWRHWECKLNIAYDSDMIPASSVLN